MAVTPPEHRARTRRWGREEKRRHSRRAREAAAAERNARPERARSDEKKVGVGVVGPAASSPVIKKPRLLPSLTGEAFRPLCSAESVDDIEDGEIVDVDEQVATPRFAVGVVVPTPSPPRVATGGNGSHDGGPAVLALQAPSPAARGGDGTGVRVESVDVIIEDEAATPKFAVGVVVPTPSPPRIDTGGNGSPDEGVVLALAPPKAQAPAAHHGGASTGVMAPLSSPTIPAAPSTESEVSSAPIITSLQVQAPPPLPACSSCQAPAAAPLDKNKALLLITTSKPPPLTAPAPTMRPHKTKMLPAAAPLRHIPPPPQPKEDASERHERLKKRFAGIITKSANDLADLHREGLKRKRAEAEAQAAADQKMLLELAAIAADRKMFRVWLLRKEEEAEREALFVRIARPQHLRELGIDAAMEGVVSPERPRGEDGMPIVLPEHPCCPLEKLGLFLKSPPF